MQATAILKFKHCNYGEHYAEAMASYDSAPQTAWIGPFTTAQRAYWSQQDGDLINGYAEAYSIGRNNAIDQAAQSAYNNCMAGGASTPTVHPTEPVFRLAISTQLVGGGSLGGASSNTGLSTRLSVPFAPVAVQQQYPLDWRAFYRVGAIQISYNYADNWLLSFSSGGYTEPSYTTLPMRPSVHVQANNLVAFDAGYMPYMAVPEGQSISVPDSLVADFNAVQSHFSFTIQRRVVLPDGQILQEEVDYDDGFNDGVLSDVSATVNLPALNASCDVSGTVDVYHFITAYSFGSLYRLNNQMQQVRVDGVDYDFTVPADAFGSVPPSYGPPGLKAIHESFYYITDPLAPLAALEIDYIWDYKSPLFYRVVFKLINTSTQSMGVVLNFSDGHKAWVLVPSTSTKYYACLVRTSVGVLTAQRTSTAPETNPAGLAEKEVSTTSAIKVYSSTMQYDYPGASGGFIPANKSVINPSSGTSNFTTIDYPNIPSTTWTAPVSPWLINSAYAFVVIATWQKRVGVSWLDAAGGLEINKYAFYQALDIQGKLEIDPADMGIVPDGRVWVDKFYRTGGLVVLDQNSIHMGLLSAIASDATIRNVTINAEPPGFGAYIDPSKLQMAKLKDVADMTLSNANFAGEKLQYYF